MNSIKKQKCALLCLGIIAIVLGIALIVIGILALVKGAEEILYIAPGILCFIAAFPALWFGIKAIWVASALVATKGSIKEGNIAKEGGTVNMTKCDKCGTEIKEGETVCSNCGKEIKK